MIWVFSSVIMNKLQYASLEYRSIQPKGKFNRVEHEVWTSYRFLQRPYRYEYLSFSTGYLD